MFTENIFITNEGEGLIENSNKIGENTVKNVKIRIIRGNQPNQQNPNKTHSIEYFTQCFDLSHIIPWCL